MDQVSLIMRDFVFSAQDNIVDRTKKSLTAQDKLDILVKLDADINDLRRKYMKLLDL
jgi:hypothetical protein